MQKLILTILALALTPLVGWAETPKDSWENLKQLQPGHKIKVVDMKFKSWSGKLVSVSDEVITIREKSRQQEITVERPNVLRVTDLQRSQRGRNALLGLAIGGALGAPLGAAHASDLPAEVGAAIMAGLLGGAGAGIGALVPSHSTIYRAQQEPQKPAAQLHSLEFDH